MFASSQTQIGHLPSPAIVDAESLDRASLQQLLDMDVIAIRIRRFYEPALCKALAQQLFENVATDGAIYSSNIDSFWSARKNEELLERYLTSTHTLEQQLRQASAPHSSPVDLIRAAIGDAWGCGASLMETRGREMPFGITRLWSAGSEALPHQDVLWREIPDEASDRQLGQLAINLYLDTASEGGELELWSYVVDDEQYKRCGREYEGSYGFPRTLLPPTSVLITPEVGDLVVINSLRVHAVRRVERGRRITLSGFIGMWGSDRPLRLWS